MMSNFMKISNVFDATKDPNFVQYDNDLKCKNPYVFTVSMKGFVLIGGGYETLEKAENARKNFFYKFDPFDYMAVVLKNADFTEGNGPMVFHKLFKYPEDAHDYVMSQEGIYGSEQYHQISYGINSVGELYHIQFYNGYNIILAKIEKGI